MCICDIGQSILAIVTLAAPHQQAPANVHAPLHAFYSRLQRAAAAGTSLGPADGKAAGSGKAKVPLLSVAGGRALARYILSSLQLCLYNSNNIQCYTARLGLGIRFSGL